jgi:hypothetical protein
MLLLLHHLHNHITPASRLPAEILCAIFGSAQEHGTDGTGDMFAFTHVCQRWRDAVIDHSELWSNMAITTRSTAAHELCLERSKSCQLNITLCVPMEKTGRSGERIPDNMKLLAAHNHRIKSVYLDVPLGMEGVLRHFDFAVPHLRNFECVPRIPPLPIRNDHEEDDRAFQLPFTYDFKFFRDEMLGLKSATLVDMSNSSLFYFRSLSSLTLTSQRHTGMSLSRSSFFSLLRASPELEYLEVNHYTLFSPRRVDMVVLPALRKISLDRSTSYLILSGIETPGLRELVIQHPKYSIFLGTVNTKLLPTDFPIAEHIAKLEVKSSGLASDYYEIHGYDSTGSASYTFRGPGNPDYQLDYLSGMSLPQFAVLTLECGEDAFENLESVGRFLVSARSLVVLRLMHPNPVPFLKILAQNSACCTDLCKIVVCISRETHVEVFRAVEDVVLSRLPLGTTVVVGHVTLGEEDSDELSLIWNGMCEEHGIHT